MKPVALFRCFNHVQTSETLWSNNLDKKMTNNVVGNDNADVNPSAVASVATEVLNDMGIEAMDMVILLMVVAAVILLGALYP